MSLKPALIIVALIVVVAIYGFINNKNESITQIAYECGFNNVSNFNRCFKMIKKSNPGKYRKDLEMM